MRCGGFKAQARRAEALNNHSKWPAIFGCASLAHRDDASASSREKNENSFQESFLIRKIFIQRKCFF